jgi:RNA polymerase sigma-70 factor (ECF subfamily)
MQAEGFRELVHRAKQGDQQALERLLALVRPALERRARTYASVDQPEASISDLVQCVCLKVWQKLDQLVCGDDDEQALAQFQAWTFQILHRQGLNAVRFRSAQRRQAAQKPVRLGPASAEKGYSPTVAEPAGTEATPSSQARCREEATLVRQAVERLEEEMDRTIVQMRFYEGLSLRQIAERLEINEHKVRERCHFALKRLERELGELS